MKKYIITAIIIAIATGSYWYYAQAAIVTVDSYSEANYSAYTSVSSTAGHYLSLGQSFTATGVTLDNVQFYLRKNGSPTGNATAILYAHSGTYGTNSVPTGSVLARSDNFDVSTLTTSMQLITLNFTGANRYSLIAGTKYIILFEYSGGDSSNYTSFALDNTSSSHTGNMVGSFSGSWNPTSTNDAIFYVYGEDGASGSVSTVSDLVLFE